MTEQTRTGGPLDVAVRGLVEEGTLTREQADRVVERLRPLLGPVPTPTPGLRKSALCARPQPVPARPL